MNCNKCLKPLSKRALQKKQKFCDRICFAEYRMVWVTCVCGLKTRNKKFCSQSCANTTINQLKIKHNQCLHCFSSISIVNTYCGSTCRARYFADIKAHIWLTTGEGAAAPNGEIRQWLVKWLKRLVDYRCQQCGWRKFHPVDGKPGIQIDHINGDNKDHRPENLRALCPECHWATETFCGRNKSKKN